MACGIGDCWNPRRLAFETFSCTAKMLVRRNSPQPTWSGLFAIIRLSMANKRAGLAAAGAFLDRNGFDLQSDQAELFALVVAVAAGEVEETMVVQWIASRLKSLES